MLASFQRPDLASPQDAARPTGAAAGVRVLALACLGGLLTGAAHLDGALWPLAWLGVAMLGAAARLPARAGWLALGLVLSGFAGHWMAHPWHLAGLARYVPGGLPTAWKLVVPFTLAWTLPQRLPLVLAWLAGRRWRVPAWIWLPAGWWAGEAVWDATIGLSHDALLYSQWQVAPVLRAVGWLGWTPAMLLGLAASAAAGEAVVLRSRRLAALPLAIAAGLLALPALPVGDLHQLDGVGAVHLHQFGSPPKAAPAGLSLLVWPEISTSRIPRLEEGPGHGERLRLPPVAVPCCQLLGQLVRSRGGMYNGLVATAPDGTVLGMRGKIRLFPLTERPVLGFMLGGGSPFRQGERPPVLEAAGRRVTGLVCVEELDRGVVAWGRREGATMVAIASNDWGLGDSAIAHQQVLAAAVFRAVEAHAPLVRASLFGPAAFIAADGRVLAQAPPATDGILTLAGDHANPPAPTQ